MEEARLSDDEPLRLQNLYSYRILDTAPDDAFEEIANLAADICDAPIALVSLVSDTRQWFKVHVGLDVEETARSVSFCAHAILQDDLFIVSDTLKDPRFADNPLVTGPPHIRFYAGAPLHTDEGYNVGTLCIIDLQPRELTPIQRKALSVLRHHVLTLMKIRRQNMELRGLNNELTSIGAVVSHDLVAPMRRILGFSRILKEDHAVDLGKDGEEVVDRVQAAARNMKERVESLSALFNVSRSPLYLTKLNLSELAEKVLLELKATDPVRHLEYRIEPDLFVYSDARVLRILLEKLLENAWKFTANNSLTRIEIGREEKDGRTLFYVRDNGTGFDMSGARRLFVPFQRLHSEKQFKGAGVGLAVVQRILNRHGGEIFCESTRDEGTTFYFYL